jgi:hypothetical protein
MRTSPARSSPNRSAFDFGIIGINRVMLCGSLIILRISHTYRTWEYLARRPNPFCFNLPLFIVNEVKSTDLLIMLVFSSIHTF